MAALAVLVAVAAVLVIRPWETEPGGAVAGDGGGGDGTAELAGQVGWAVKSAGRPRLVNGAEGFGSWVAGELFVRADNDVISARDAAGKEAWGLRPPEGAMFCGVSREAVSGTIAMAYGKVQTNTVATGLKSVWCTNVVLVDLATGKVRWDADLTGTDNYRTLRRIGSSPNQGMSLAIAGDTVVVGYYWSAVGLDVAGGRIRWEMKKIPTRAGDSTCVVEDVLAGRTGAVLLAGCDRRDPAAVISVDPATGDRRWRADLPAETLGDTLTVGRSLVSADPPVLASRGGAARNGRYLVLDDSGQVAATIPQRGSWGELDMSPLGFGIRRARYRTMVGADTLVTVTAEQRVNQLRSTNQVVAFDLRSGRPKWTAGLGPETTAVPAAVDRDTVIVMRTGTYEAPPQAYRLKLADGKGGPMGPAYGRDLIYAPAGSLFRFTGKALFMASDRGIKFSAVLLR
ncbi:outer membrane protein assembly factor BamB family protein [Sphaerisporangium rufum]|uniref:outer membrane protein assembly factor BamB family protein n=1 Tax=Sphaerisporangium rufum TaxID=1381558 RepID=UPI0019522420|nr:PQQ-binding-like beta-propeller repeat protein [Sphaerisporangium rufum]